MSLKYVSVVVVATMLAMAAVLAASATQPRSAEAATTVAVKGCTGTNVALTTAEKRVLDLHNQARASRGLSKFCVHPALQRAARAHSKEMIDRDYSSHNSFNGESYDTRLKKYGYTSQPGRYWTVGENIACNTDRDVASANKVQNQWMNSPGHRANILSSKFKQIGIGAAYGYYTGNGNCKGHNVTMWTADFGAR